MTIKFSKEIEDISNLILVSSISPVEFDAIETDTEDFLVRLEIDDSTFWELEFY